MLVYQNTNSFITLGKLVESKLEGWAKKSNSVHLRITWLMLIKMLWRKFSDFFQKLMTIIDNVAPCKTKWVRGNAEKWFDGDVLGKLRLRDKLFKAFKKTRLHIDKGLFKKAKYNAQKLIAAKKQAFFDEKRSEGVCKPKVLWDTLKPYGIPKKTVVSMCNAIDDNKSLPYDIKTVSNVFEDFFSNLAKSFLDKLPDP